MRGLNHRNSAISGKCNGCLGSTAFDSMGSRSFRLASVAGENGEKLPDKSSARYSEQSF